MKNIKMNHEKKYSNEHIISLIRKGKITPYKFTNETTALLRRCKCKTCQDEAQLRDDAVRIWRTYDES